MREISNDNAVKPSNSFGRLSLTPLNRRRLENFKANKRALYSFWIFFILFMISIMSNFIANDKPLIISYENDVLFPIFKAYPETRFGGIFETEADYKDPFVKNLIDEKGWMIWPLISFSYDTINIQGDYRHPAPPSYENWLGTDDQGRDVVARMVYGFRISVLFGLALTISSVIFGVTAGAVQGYFGGFVDLSLQRFVEVWENLPQFYLLIIMSSFIVPGIFTIFFILALFSWIQLTPIVRAEFFRARNLDYVRAATALGVSHVVVMYRHLLPNAMVATLTMLPFLLTGSIVSLTSLDFLGFGLPPGEPSLGELLQQGRNNLGAPWLGITAIMTLGTMLTLLTFVGEGIRDAMDPRKSISPQNQSIKGAQK
ncbi:MAG: ABC transporter permease [Emcibacteraceae bacterium]|nr:ABC transporter permease [Emcibacteraceae bacterium]